MKKRLVVALAVVSISATATVAMAGEKAGTGINGSLHDINVVGGGYSQDAQLRTCVFCHTPHNAIKADVNVPLWNHAQTKLQSPTAYSWVAPANIESGVSIDAADPLKGPSRLCMACHDGSTAVDSHGSAGSGTYDPNAGQAMVDGVAKASYMDGLNHKATRYITDLTVTHPIGFDYNAIADKRGIQEIVPSAHGFIRDNISEVPAVAKLWDTKVGSTTRTAANETTKKIKDTLYGGGIMTCASCHDVHNTLNVSDSTNSYNYFLYARQEGSAICISCHVK